ncbi:MAG: flagellar assembly protein FliW [Clostridia bacterium]|nr:flagellar assembly protein FliW [Clostridia bacterium]
MKIVTDYRGEVEYTEDDIIHFEDSMYGFDGKKDFLLIANIEPELPFHWLQSIEDESLTFVITDPFLFVEKYDFELDDLTVEKLNLNSVEDIMIYTTVIIPDSVEEITINLKSPIIININDRKAKQVILSEDYPYKHKIFQKGEA